MNNPTYTCLTTAIQESDQLTNAINSGIADGWNINYFLDTYKTGQNRSREFLLDQTINNTDIQYIRYLDDDDLLLPHKEAISSIFSTNPSIDIIYTNYNMVMPSGIVHNLSFTGNPTEDTMSVHPWSWVARKSALLRVKDQYGSVWDYNTPYREGGYLWLKFIRLHLNIHYLAISAYQYNKSFNPNKLSNHQDFFKSSDELFNEIKNLDKCAQLKL